MKQPDALALALFLCKIQGANLLHSNEITSYPSNCEISSKRASITRVLEWVVEFPSAM